MWRTNWIFPCGGAGLWKMHRWSAERHEKVERKSLKRVWLKCLFVWISLVSPFLTEARKLTRAKWSPRICNPFKRLCCQGIKISRINLCESSLLVVFLLEVYSLMCFINCLICYCADGWSKHYNLSSRRFVFLGVIVRRRLFYMHTNHSPTSIVVMAFTHTFSIVIKGNLLCPITPRISFTYNATWEIKPTPLWLVQLS